MSNIDPTPEPEKVYLGNTKFTDEDYYSVEVTDRGVTVYSECCADTMSDETARKLRDAISEYLAAKEMAA